MKELTPKEREDLQALRGISPNPTPEQIEVQLKEKGIVPEAVVRSPPNPRIGIVRRIEFETKPYSKQDKDAEVYVIVARRLANGKMHETRLHWKNALANLQVVEV